MDCQVAVLNLPAAVTLDPPQFDSPRRGFPVDVIKDAAACREIDHTPAGESGFHRNAAGGPRCGNRAAAAAAAADIIVPAPTVTWKRLSISNFFLRMSRSAA